MAHSTGSDDALKEVGVGFFVALRCIATGKQQKEEG